MSYDPNNLKWPVIVDAGDLVMLMAAARDQAGFLKHSIEEGPERCCSEEEEVEKAAFAAYSQALEGVTEALEAQDVEFDFDLPRL